MSAKSRVEFAQWLKDTHPDIFAKAIAIASNSTQNGLGAVDFMGREIVGATSNGGSFWEKFQAAAVGLGTTYLTLKNQRDAMEINLARAKAGQPPIDMATSAPVVRTQVDMSPELTQRLVSNIGSSLQTPLLIAGAAIAAFFLFRKK